MCSKYNLPADMSCNIGNQLICFAFVTRFFIIWLQFIANSLIPDHDANVFDPPVNRSNFSTFDHSVDVFIGGFRRWDAVYFVHIAEHGYSYENCAAFFPLFPFIVSMGARCISLTGLLHLHTSILVVSLVVNVSLFICTARALYALGLKVGLNRSTSFLSCVAYCINPASIFMTAPYSETIYFFLLVCALLLLQNKRNYLASILIGLSIFARSNGLVGIGFIVHSIISRFVTFYSVAKVSKKPKSFGYLILHSFQTVIEIVICVILSIMPFILYQYNIYLNFCSQGVDQTKLPDNIIEYGRNMSYKLPGDGLSPWCSNSIPLSYSYIQSHYWVVGFLKYYEFKQIPNFVLASPVVCIAVCCCLYIFNMNRGIFYGLGFTDVTSWKNKQQMEQSQTSLSIRNVKMTEKIAVFVFHLAFLVVFGCIFAHIQILTRMLFSSTPLLYWFCALKLLEDPVISTYVDELFKNSASSSNQLLSLPACSPLRVLSYIFTEYSNLFRTSRAIIIYFLGYFFIGTIVFCNFLPWT